MRFARLVLCVAALVGLPAHAGPGDGFTINFPAGWSAPAADDEALETRAPESAGDAWCRANSNAMPSLADATQAQLNMENADPWTAATWADVLTVPADKIQISAGVSTQVDGHLKQEVTIAFEEDVFGAKVTGRFVSHVLVGRMVNAACFARTEAFDGMKDLFQKAVTSLKPTG